MGAARDALLQEVDRIEVWVNNAGVLVTGGVGSADIELADAPVTRRTRALTR